MRGLLSIGSLAIIVSVQATSAASIDNKTYEYIVVGSGPGGAPLASNLARAGHSVLLIEAGDDQTENVSNYTVFDYIVADHDVKLNVSQWINFNAAGNDPATRW